MVLLGFHIIMAIIAAIVVVIIIVVFTLTLWIFFPMTLNVVCIF